MVISLSFIFIFVEVKEDGVEAIFFLDDINW
jgi:hypothetical protein